MITFSSGEIATWTQADFDALSGERIELRVGDGLVRDAVVERAVLHPDEGQTCTVEFVGGGSWSWGRELSETCFVYRGWRLAKRDGKPVQSDLRSPLAFP